MVTKEKEENTTLSFTKKRIEQKNNQFVIYININSSIWLTDIYKNNYSFYYVATVAF